MNNSKQILDGFSQMFPSELNGSFLKDNSKKIKTTDDDFLNLVDFLNSIPKDAFDKDKTTYIPVKDIDLNNKANNIKIKEVPSEPSSLFTKITPTVNKNSTNETYFIKNKIVNDDYASETKLRFREKFENGDIAAGITDEDLIWILLYRNSDYDKRFNLLERVLKTYC